MILGHLLLILFFIYYYVPYTDLNMSYHVNHCEKKKCKIWYPNKLVFLFKKIVLLCYFKMK